MARQRRQRKYETYVPPPGSPPLSEVLLGIAEGQRKLDTLDREIGAKLETIERRFRQLRPTGYPVDVPFPPWGKLAWSVRRGWWRLVVIEDDECTDLCNMPKLCWIDACGVLGKLAERMGLL